MLLAFEDLDVFVFKLRPAAYFSRKIINLKNIPPPVTSFHFFTHEPHKPMSGDLEGKDGGGSRFLHISRFDKITPLRTPTLHS